MRVVAYIIYFIESIVLLSILFYGFFTLIRLFIKYIKGD